MPLTGRVGDRVAVGLAAVRVAVEGVVDLAVEDDEQARARRRRTGRCPPRARSEGDVRPGGRPRCRCALEDEPALRGPEPRTVTVLSREFRVTVPAGCLVLRADERRRAAGPCSWRWRERPPLPCGLRDSLTHWPWLAGCPLPSGRPGRAHAAEGDDGGDECGEYEAMTQGCSSRWAPSRSGRRRSRKGSGRSTPCRVLRDRDVHRASTRQHGHRRVRTSGAAACGRTADRPRRPGPRRPGRRSRAWTRRCRSAPVPRRSTVVRPSSTRCSSPASASAAGRGRAVRRGRRPPGRAGRSAGGPGRRVEPASRAPPARPGDGGQRPPPPRRRSLRERRRAASLHPPPSRKRFNRYPQQSAGFSMGPSVPLPLVTFRRRPRIPRLLIRRPEGAVPGDGR